MKHRYLALALGLIACASAFPANAQTPPTAPQLSYYPPASITPISFAGTTSSGSTPVVLPANQLHYPGVGFMNVGSNEAFCKLGNASVAVTTSSYQFEVPAGGFRAAWDASSGYVVCVTASGTATVRISQSNGAPLMGGPGGSGGGGGPTADVNILSPIGQTAMAAAVSVVVASDQSSIPITAASLPLPAGAATSALQTSGNTSLSTIATNSGTQATAANQTAVQGSKSGGTAAASALLDGAIFLTSRPTLTNGQQAALEMDSATNLFVNCAVGCNGSNASVSATGSAVPASATYIGMTVAGTLTGLVGTSNGLKVDGSAVTQPVSNGGTFAAQLTGATNNINNIAGTISLPTGAATASLQTSGNASLTTIAAAAGSSIPAGTAIIGKVGIDQTTPGTTNGVSLVGVNGATALAGNGTTGTGSPRQTIASDNSALAAWGQGATGSAEPSGATLAGARSSSTMVGIIQADASAPVSMNSNTILEIVPLTSGKKIYVTAYKILSAGTANFKFVYGTGTNCGTGTTDLEGLNALTAQTGSSIGSGLGPVLVVPASNALCGSDSAAIQISGHVAYTKDP